MWRFLQTHDCVVSAGVISMSVLFDLIESLVDREEPSGCSEKGE